MNKRNTFILLLIAAYLILNWGFMLIRIPPVAGSGVPVGELFLVLSLCFIFKDAKLLPQFTNNIIFVPFLLWWALGIGKALYALPEHGMWALRDASHVIESLYLWIGFVFAASPGAIDRLFVWLPRILGIVCIYALAYPWEAKLAALSPVIVSAAGKQTAIFFQYVGIGQLVIWEAVRRLISRSGDILIPSLLIVYAIGMFQARTNYLQLIAMIVLLLWYRRKAFTKMSLALVCGVVALTLLVESGIEIKGRLGENISFDFLSNHFAAITGAESEGASEGVKGAAGGVGQRMGWWQNILDRLMENGQNLIFGLGYGFPLIDFQGPSGEVVREPHNSYLSIFGRIGLMGLLLFVSAHMLLIRSWWKSFKLCRLKNYKVGQDRLFILMVYFVLIWINSLGEDAFEKPFYIIPYYFFWGVVLQYRIQLLSLLNTNKSQPDEDPEVVGKPELIHSPEMRVR